MSDLIERQAAIDDIWTVSPLARIDREWVDRWLRQLPPAEPKRGRWIPVTNGRGGHECDQCHNYAPSYQTGEEHLSDFCPSCGAKMEVTE